MVEARIKACWYRYVHLWCPQYESCINFSGKSSETLNNHYQEPIRWYSENTFMKYYNKAISEPADNFGQQLRTAL